MNRKNTFLTLAILGLFVTSIYAADVSRAVLVTDQIDLVVGTYVNGKLLFTNSTINDHLIAYINIEVEDAFATTDSSDSLFKVKVIYTIDDTSLFSIGDFDVIEMTHVIAKINRTDILPAGRLYLGNATFGVTMTTLYNTTAVGMLDWENTLKITFNNGTEYFYDEVTSPALQLALDEYVFAWAIFNLGLADYWTWTFLAISPTANTGDDVSYEPAFGEVLGKPALLLATGKSYDSIQVLYNVPTWGFVFGGANALEVFYDAKTGLIMKTIETLGADKAEFIPTEIKNVKGIPFSTTAIIAAITVLSTLALIVRKRRNQ
jgi:hypothetical protein